MLRGAFDIRGCGDVHKLFGERITLITFSYPGTTVGLTRRRLKDRDRIGLAFYLRKVGAYSLRPCCRSKSVIREEHH